MTFEEILDQAAAMLERRGRVTYRTLKLQFQLDEEYLETLKEELIDGQRVAVDEDGKVLVWTGGEGTGESENRRIGEPKTSPQPPTPNTQPPAATRQRISPNASARNKRRWKRGAQPMVNARRSRRCLPISKARRR